jgi:two-component system cell cycle response regulator
MSKILVVDDVSANVEILKIHLSDEDHQVFEAQSGKQALQILHDSLQDPEHDIDLILLDVVMPVMSGLEVLAHIKKDAQLKNIPIILVTANADEKSVAEGLDLGAFDYIIKPYSLVILLARVRTALREKERQDLLEKWATTDPLTALFNRRHFFDLTLRELDRSNRLNSPLSFIMLDIDNFKQVNDQFGHLVGDLALVMLAKMLKQQLRSVDLCCRYGGEEFVLCLPDTHIEGAREVAERIRLAISLQSIPSNDARTLSISISLGVAGNQQNQSVEDILKRADMALYQAKGNGRNQTCIAN